jgi:predicted DNA-binding transcriptional regulator AlpA
VDRATVGQWQHRELLPAPIATTSGGKVWLRSDIENWLRKTGRVHEPSLEQ